jgi:hypothetical protein
MRGGWHLKIKDKKQGVVVQLLEHLRPPKAALASTSMSISVSIAISIYFYLSIYSSIYTSIYLYRHLEPLRGSTRRGPRPARCRGVGALKRSPFNEPFNKPGLQ